MKFTFFISGILFLGIACSNTLDYDNTKYLSDKDITKADEMEASQISLWFEGKLTDPGYLNEVIQQDLKRIRNEAPDSLQKIVSKRFQLPWMTGEIIVAFDDTTSQSVLNQEYNGWSNLADSLRPESMLREPDKELGIGLFKVKSNYNPIILSNIYVSLPGIRFAEPNFVNHGGENSFPIYPYLQPDVSRYLFQENSKLYLFEMKSGESTEIKFWNRRLKSAPSWWDDINTVYANFSQWPGTDANRMNK